MKTGFKEWMLKKEASMDTTGMYTPVSGPAPVSNSSQMGFTVNQQPQQPAANPNIPWQMSFFQRWYDFHRGSWNDVVKAAKSDPNVRAFMGQMAKSLVQDGPFNPQQPKQPGTYFDDDEFDTEKPTKMGQLADQLENMVRKIIPTHGHRQRDPSNYPPQGARPAMNQGGPSSAMGRSPQGLTPMHSQLQDMQSRVQDQNTSQLIDVVRTLMLRIDDIERRIGGNVTTAA